MRLGPDEVPVDFAKPYRIKAMFANEVFSAVQFKVAVTHADGSSSNIKVWTNVRRHGDGWAEILDSSAFANPTFENRVVLASATSPRQAAAAGQAGGDARPR